MTDVLTLTWSLMIYLHLVARESLYCFLTEKYIKKQINH